MKKTLKLSGFFAAIVTVALLLIAVPSGHKAFATSASSDLHHVIRIKVPMTVVQTAKGVVSPNGQHPGDCGTIEFYLATDGSSTATGEEYVDTFLGVITQLSYSTYIVNQSTGKGQGFGDTVYPDADAWSHEDTAVTGRGYITGTFSATDYVSEGVQCTGSESDAITI